MAPFQNIHDKGGILIYSTRLFPLSRHTVSSPFINRQSGTSAFDKTDRNPIGSDFPLPKRILSKNRKCFFRIPRYNKPTHLIR